MYMCVCVCVIKATTTGKTRKRTNVFSKLVSEATA